MKVVFCKISSVCLVVSSFDSFIICTITSDKSIFKIRLIFNFNNVDRTKTIYVTEGPIDSLFLPNGIAVAGSDFKKIPEDIKDNAILIYDNEPRNKQIIKKMEEVIDLGYRVCIWNDKRITEYKDINDMIMSGLSESEVVEIINRNTVYGLSAKLQLMEYKKT